MSDSQFIAELSIDRRFCGPPQSANGGYACGAVARHLDGVARVRLLAPPPLQRDLQLSRQGETWRLHDGERALAQARFATLSLQAPAAPSLAEARRASQRFIGHRSHPFPGCFVCGPARDEGDGLRIFPGAVEGRDLVAASWTPAANLANSDGRVAGEFIWSALDCTGFFAFAPLPDGAPALLGELTARIDGEIIAGEDHIAVGWMLGSEGRKRHTGSALYNARGDTLAVAEGTWIVMPAGAAGAVG